MKYVIRLIVGLLLIGIGMMCMIIANLPMFRAEDQHKNNNQVNQVSVVAEVAEKKSEKKTYVVQAKEIQDPGYSYCVVASSSSGSKGEVIWWANPGTKVNAGDEIVRVNYLPGHTDKLKLELKKAEQQMIIAQTNLITKEKDLKVQHRLVKEGLFAKLSLHEYEQDVIIARSQLAIANLNITIAKMQSNPCHFDSDITGEVVWVNENLRAGTPIQNTSKMILMKVAGLSQMEAEVPCDRGNWKAEAETESGKKLKIINVRRTDKGIAVRFNNPQHLVKYDDDIKVTISK